MMAHRGPPPTLESAPAPKPKVPLLRRFRSLGDLRGSKSSSTTPTDAPPVPPLPAPAPAPAAPAMARAYTQPTPAPRMARTSSASATWSSSSRDLSGRRPSTATIFDGVISFPPSSPPLHSFRQAPNGRVDRVPPPPVARSSSHANSHGHGHGHGHGHSRSHSRTPSLLSLSSSTGTPSYETVMARSYSSPGGSHSRRSSRSSADYSDSSYLSSNPPQTPPTPHRLEGEPGGKYVFAEGHLVQTNLVPLPPFFDRPTVTFKVLHPESNLLIRLPRDGLSLEQLRHQVERKFALSAGIKLDGEDGQTQWALSYIKNGGRGSDPAAIAELIASEDDFKQALVHTSAQTKVSLRIVS
ncbi:Phox-like domain-containing protein [Pseudohyphozyma bogoriensis]|nr:Phox-like domain-containing protein [Pseudohyphozyma bogoriensis]